MSKEGAKVVVVDIDGAKAERAAEAVGGVPVRADVSKSSEWDSVTQAARSLGGLDIAYLNAGVTTGQEDLTLMDDDQYRRIVGVNIDGVVFGVRAVLPEIEARGGGAIVMTSSLAGIIAFPADPMYTMTKHAVVGLARSLAPRLAEKSITVNAICPGLVDTPLIDGQVRDALIGTGFPLIDPSAVAEAVLGAVLGEETGQAIVVQAGREPTSYRFGRAPGPRAAGAEGKIPPGWLADQGGSNS